MSILSNSLKRLYKKGSIKLDYLDGLLEQGKITKEEYDHIITQ